MYFCGRKLRHICVSTEEYSMTTLVGIFQVHDIATDDAHYIHKRYHSRTSKNVLEQVTVELLSKKTNHVMEFVGRCLQIGIPTSVTMTLASDGTSRCTPPRYGPYVQEQFEKSGIKEPLVRCCAEMVILVEGMCRSMAPIADACDSHVGDKTITIPGNTRPSPPVSVHAGSAGLRHRKKLNDQSLQTNCNFESTYER